MGDVADPDETPEDLRSPRIEGLAALESTPRRSEERRLASAMRRIIEELGSTTATTQELAEAADELEALAATLEGYPHGQTYRSYAESANAGGATGDLSLRKLMPALYLRTGRPCSTTARSSGWPTPCRRRCTSSTAATPWSGR